MNQLFKQAKQGDRTALEQIVHMVLHEQFEQESFVNGIDTRESFSIAVTKYIAENINRYKTLANLKRAITTRLQLLLKEKVLSCDTPKKLVNIIANNALPNIPRANNAKSNACKMKDCVLKRKLDKTCRECVEAGFNHSSVSILIKAHVEKKFKLVGIDNIKQKWGEKIDFSKANKTHKNGVKALFYLLLTDHLTEGKSDKLISKAQYVTSLQYFYGLQQKGIDAVTPKGVMGYRWKGKSKDVLTGFFKKALDRLDSDTYVDAKVKTKVDKYIDDIW